MNLLVSFPRSGQHLTEKLLREIHRRLGIPYSYCSNGGNPMPSAECNCDLLPCKSQCKFKKTHDFNLDIPIRAEDRYLVLYRSDPVDQMEAFYRWTSKMDCVSSSNAIAFAKFAKMRMRYYRAFISKWTCGAANVRVVEFRKLLASPTEELCGICSFFGIDIAHGIDDAVSAVPIVRRQASSGYFNICRKAGTLLGIDWES